MRHLLDHDDGWPVVSTRTFLAYLLAGLVLVVVGWVGVVGFVVTFG